MTSRHGAANWLTLVLLVLLVIGVGAITMLAQRLADAGRDASIAAANRRALEDTLRTYESEHDTLTRTVQRFAFQGEVNTDSILRLNNSLSEALRENRETVRALTRAEFVIDAYEDSLTATHDVDVLGQDSVEFREASTTLTGPPLDGTITVQIPPRPDAVRFYPVLTPTPFSVDLTISCTEEGDADPGITTPRWVTASIGRATVTEDVCHPRQAMSFGSFKLTAGGIGLGALGGLVLGLLIGAL